MNKTLKVKEKQRNVNHLDHAIRWKSDSTIIPISGTKRKGKEENENQTAHYGRETVTGQVKNNYEVRKEIDSKYHEAESSESWKIRANPYQGNNQRLNDLIEQNRTTLFAQAKEWKNQKLWGTRDIGSLIVANRLNHLDHQVGSRSERLENQRKFAKQTNQCNKKIQFASKVTALKDQSKKWYYFHPIAFSTNFMKMGVINPYLGVTETLYRVPVEIIDNPGFAPYDGGAINHGYTGITGGFNEDYTIYYHEGVDFAGVRLGNTPIKSFITGKVVGKGDQGNLNYGKFLIIENTIDKDGSNTLYYLLGHLAEYNVDIDQLVYPDMIVGYAGNTGNCRTGGRRITDAERAQGVGTHLHLSLLKVGRLTDIYNENAHTPRRIMSNSYNPFKHSEKRKEVYP